MRKKHKKLKKEWSKDEENFIKENHDKMTYEQMSTSLGITRGVLNTKIQSMIALNQLIRQKANGAALDSDLERRGRAKTYQLKSIKESIDTLEVIRFKRALSTSKIITGRIIQRTDNFITIDTGNSKESFSYVDFYNKIYVLV